MTTDAKKAYMREYNRKYHPLEGCLMFAGRVIDGPKRGESITSMYPEMRAYERSPMSWRPDLKAFLKRGGRRRLLRPPRPFCRRTCGLVTRPHGVASNLRREEAKADPVRIRR